MDEQSDANKSSPDKPRYACPQCGHELSPWQQVLLTVDRALVCRNCWHRIIWDIDDDDAFPPPAPKE